MSDEDGICFLSFSICKVGGSHIVPKLWHLLAAEMPFFFSPPLDNLERFGNRDQPCFQFCTDSETAPEGFTVTYVLEWAWQLHMWRGKLLAPHLLASWFFNSRAARKWGFNSDCCLMYYLVDLNHLSSSVKHGSVCVFLNILSCVWGMWVSSELCPGRCLVTCINENWKGCKYCVHYALVGLKKPQMIFSTCRTWAINLC